MGTVGLHGLQRFRRGYGVEGFRNGTVYCQASVKHGRARVSGSRASLAQLWVEKQ